MAVLITHRTWENLTFDMIKLYNHNHLTTLKYIYSRAVFPLPVYIFLVFTEQSNYRLNHLVTV